MKALIVEDEILSRQILIEILKPFGVCDSAADGIEAVNKFRLAFESSAPYDLVTMDIMMPNLNGQEALKQIRAIEKSGADKAGFQKTRVIMTSSLDDQISVSSAMYGGEAVFYLVKPIDRDALLKQLQRFGFIP